MFKIFKYTLTLVFKHLTERALLQASIFTRLSLGFLAASTAALVPRPEFWELVINKTFQLIQEPGCPSCQYGNLVGYIFLLLSMIFGVISFLTSKKSKNKLIDSKIISEGLKVGNSTIRCFCGSILNLSEEAEVIVTSEDTELSLGKIFGTSVSGRARRIFADINENGFVVNDHVKHYIDQWKRKKNLIAPFKLGLVIPNDAYNDNRQGVKKVIHLVSIEKNNSGNVIIQETSIRDGLISLFDFLDSTNFNSVFIPLFGTGSGGKEAKTASSITVNPLIQILRNKAKDYEVFLGTYRLKDAIYTSNEILTQLSGL